MFWLRQDSGVCLSCLKEDQIHWDEWLVECCAAIAGKARSEPKFAFSTLLLLYQVFRPFLNRIRIRGSVIFETFAWKASCITTYRLGYTYSLTSVYKLIILYKTIFLLLNADLNILNAEWAQFYNKEILCVNKGKTGNKYIFKWIISDIFLPPFCIFQIFYKWIYFLQAYMCVYMCMCICIYLENNLSLQTLSVLFKNKAINLFCNLDERITTPVSDNWCAIFGHHF